MANSMKMLKNFGALCFVSLASTFGVANAAQAWETFQVNGGIALNTNNASAKFDTQPVMYSYEHNINDPDQQFVRIPGRRGGTLLQHKSTGKCLNAHYLKNGARMNVWSCNPDDPDQNFNINDLGGGYRQIQRTGTNFCVDSPYREKRGGIVHLWDCNASNPNQRWLSSSNTPVATNPVPTNPISTGFYRNPDNFFSWANGQRNIKRLDTSSYVGQCVSLVARYVQEVKLPSSTRTQRLAYGNAKDTAATVASKFPQYFNPYTSAGLPKRGAVISFNTSHQYGHTGIVTESRYYYGKRQVRFLESNWDNKAPNTSVRVSPWYNLDYNNINGLRTVRGWTNPK